MKRENRHTHNVLMRAVFTFYLLSLLNAIINDELRWNSIECVLKSKTAITFFPLSLSTGLCKSRFVFFRASCFNFRFRCVFSLTTELMHIDWCQCILFFDWCKFIAIDSTHALTQRERETDNCISYLLSFPLAFASQQLRDPCAQLWINRITICFIQLRQVFLSMNAIKLVL